MNLTKVFISSNGHEFSNPAWLDQADGSVYMEKDGSEYWSLYHPRQSDIEGAGYTVRYDDTTEPSTDKTNPKDRIGVTKPPVSAIPPVAILNLGKAMQDGKEKYGHMNWRETSVRSDVYYNAMMRHLLQWFDGEDRADDSNCHHLAHVMACCAIILDAEASGSLIDDRPTSAKVATHYIKENTKT